MQAVGARRACLDNPMDIGNELLFSRHARVHPAQQQEGSGKADHGTHENCWILGKTEGLQGERAQNGATHQPDERHNPDQERDLQLRVTWQSQLDEIADAGADAILDRDPSRLGRASAKVESTRTSLVALPTGPAQRGIHLRPITLRTDDYRYLHLPGTPRGF